MEMDEDTFRRRADLAEAATRTGSLLFGNESRIDDFNRGCQHVFGLLADAHTLYAAKSYASAAFLAITAIEEIAKIDIGSMRHGERTMPARNRRDDHLFNHSSKHAIALQEIIKMGNRLPKAIGEQRVADLMAMADSGALVALREAALYTANVRGKFQCPAEVITATLAKELLLLALEAWDDRLVGLTSYTYELDSPLAKLFDEVAAS